MTTTNAGCGARFTVHCTRAAYHVGEHRVERAPHWEAECLQMVREDLEAYGIDMSGTPPMMFNDALRHLVSKLGLKAGFTDTREIAAYMRGLSPHQETKPNE